jgi:hypothetical protein
MREFLPGAPLDAAAHWRLTRRLTLQLLAGWFLITIAIIWFARELNALVLFGSARRNADLCRAGRLLRLAHAHAGSPLRAGA